MARLLVLGGRGPGAAAGCGVGCGAGSEDNPGGTGPVARWRQARRGDKHGGGSSSYRSACERAACDHGWHVRSVGQFSKMDGPNGGTYHALVQVRDGRHSFEALCEASADGSFVGLKRRG